MKFPRRFVRFRPSKGALRFARQVGWLFVAMLALSCTPGGGGGEEGVRAEVRSYRGRPVLFLNGEPEAAFLYALTDVPGGRWSWEEVPRYNLRRFCEAGVRLFQLDLFLRDLFDSSGVLHLEPALRQVRGVRQVCPEGVVFFRLHLNAPKEWLERHPEEWVRYDSLEPHPEPVVHLSRELQDDPRTPIRASMASQAWKDWATRSLKAFLEAFAQTPEGAALAGVQVAFGIYGEWHQWGLLTEEADFSPPMQAHFRRWALRKYGSEAA
ncbi:MAG: hypothetical protein D6765_06795, partial [Bacteroidetes bacterium]